ncbi:hypothetical protein BTM25_22730 [Actinomadura rubteroloni]|uniref:Uncharacterized protein n=1 Tax=Actinomadura rubteroloni TaxID=1926885 RepID=A0A2P4US24_9ACTN|nr:hypothetical protein BTM25_22730 [Actinomadura rubteroloni]
MISRIDSAPVPGFSFPPIVQDIRKNDRCMQRRPDVARSKRTAQSRYGFISTAGFNEHIRQRVNTRQIAATESVAQHTLRFIEFFQIQQELAIAVGGLRDAYPNRFPIEEPGPVRIRRFERLGTSHQVVSHVPSPRLTCPGPP